jgi:hypothetical protein
MAYKKSQGTPKSAPDLNDSPNSNARRHAEQMELPCVDKAAFCPSWPAHGTLVAQALDAMLAGRHINQISFNRNNWRLSGYVWTLIHKLGWPVKAGLIPHPEIPGTLIAEYSLDPEIIVQARGMRPDGLAVSPRKMVNGTTSNVDQTDQHQTKEAGSNSTINSTTNSTTPDDDSKLGAAIEFVRDLLIRNGCTLPTGQIEEMAKSTGITPKTLLRAGKALAVKKVKNGARWFWMLPVSGDDAMEVACS